MAEKNLSEEVGDLFVTSTTVTLKLLPSNREKTMPIRWFADGCVTNVHLAAKDIAALAGKLSGRSRVLRGVTVMTDRGTRGTDLDKTGLTQAVAKAGIEILK